MRITDFSDFQQRTLGGDGEIGLRARDGAARAEANILGTSQIAQNALVTGDTPLALGDDIADNTSTTTSISVGGTLNSSIQTSGDLDYIAISLVAGHAYTFSLDFAGTGFGSDGYLELRDSTGALVAQNDDGGIDLDSFLMYRATQTGTFYIVARGFDGGTTGSYTLTTDEIVTGQTSPTTFTSNGLPYFSWEEAAIQITREGQSWATAFNTPTVVTYAYRASAPASMPSDTAGFSTFSASQIAATEAALAAWASVANITFVRVNDGAGYSNNATILFGNYSSGEAGAAAFAYLPTSSPVGGDVWVNISLSDNSNITPGGYGNQVLLHEIGHALGLSHPGEYNAGQGNPTYPGSAVFYGDTRMFTTMSYFASVNTGGVYSNYASLPQVFDIAAIQRLYGANTSTRTGDTIYGFNSNTGIAEFTLTNSASQAVFTIWDGAGNDTLDLSLYTTSSLIDLREEAFSTAGPRTGGTQLAAYNIAIAHGVIIENAIGGSGDDTIIGNDANNVLDGRAGFDIMRGGLGNDTYYGNGQDTITEDLNAGIDTFVSSGNATLADNVENLTLTGSATTGTGNILANVITGNDADNTLNGDAGNDTLNGGIGADAMNGGVGDDTLDGGAGADRMDGGDGNDVIYWDSSDQLDFVLGGAGTDILVLATSAAAPTSFNLVTHGFEAAERRLVDSANQAAWATQTDFFDSIWRLDRTIVTNDNSTWSVLDYDQTNSASWASIYQAYDALGRLDIDETHYDDSSRAVLDYDQASASNWLTTWASYTVSNALDTDVVTYDDNSHAVRDFDQANAFNWQVTWASYTPSGVLDIDVFTYDDGSTAVRDLDQANQYSWDTAWASYDSQGRLDTDVITYDDGSHAVRDLDQANQYSWAQMWWLYDNNGTLISFQQTNDDGSILGGG